MIVGKRRKRISAVSGRHAPQPPFSFFICLRLDFISRVAAEHLSIASAKTFLKLAPLVAETVSVVAFHVAKEQARQHISDLT
jgi:hypothetical protein